MHALIETLGFRHVGVVRDEYAATPDGMKMFGVMELEAGFTGCRFSIGLRNSHDKTMRLALVVRIRTFVCDRLAFQGDFSPVLAKHSKNFSLLDSLVIGVDRIQRNFAPLQERVEAWRGMQITDDLAKLTIYSAFIEGELEIPKHLARDVHGNYFEPPLPDFQPRTTWSLKTAGMLIEDGGNMLVVITGWETREACLKYHSSRAYRQFVARTQHLLVGNFVVKVFRTE